MIQGKHFTVQYIYICVLIMPSKTFSHMLQKMIPDTVVSWKEFASQEFMWPGYEVRKICLPELLPSVCGVNQTKFYERDPGWSAFMSYYHLYVE